MACVFDNEVHLLQNVYGFAFISQRLCAMKIWYLVWSHPVVAHRTHSSSECQSDDLSKIWG